MQHTRQNPPGPLNHLTTGIVDHPTAPQAIHSHSVQAPDFSSTVKTPDEERTNIPQRVLDQVIETCQANNMYVVIRPVNPDALPWYQNDAAGKNMYVHGKSADRGIVSGAIPINASISKAGNKDKDYDGSPDAIAKRKSKTKKFQSENDHSLSHSDDLLLEYQEELDEAVSRLEKSGQQITKEAIMNEAGLTEDHFAQIVQPLTLTTKANQPIFIFEKDGIACTAPQDNTSDVKAQDVHLYAIKASDTEYQRINDKHELIGEPFVPNLETHGVPSELKVFGKPEIKIDDNGKISIGKVRPITADVDVLAWGMQTDIFKQKVRSHADILKDDSKRIERAKNRILESTKKEYGITLANKDLKTLNQELSWLQKRQEEPKTRVESNEGLIKKYKDIIEKFESLDASALDPAANEHLRGMGDAPDSIHAITGAMRHSLPNDELSHGSEQFNYGFTQPLDNKWVVVSPNSQEKPHVIEGEQALVDFFNEVKKTHIMPPNPNWGWKLNNDGNYEINQKLKKQNELIDPLMFVSTDDMKQKEQVRNILDKRLQLGKIAINDGLDIEYREKEIERLSKELDGQIGQYKKYVNSDRTISDQEKKRWNDYVDRGIESHLKRMGGSTPNTPRGSTGSAIGSPISSTNSSRRSSTADSAISSDSRSNSIDASTNTHSLRDQLEAIQRTVSVHLAHDKTTRHIPQKSPTRTPQVPSR